MAESDFKYYFRISSYLTFRVTCIVIYSYNNSQQDALYLKFTLVSNSICFRQTYCPSSGGLNTVFTAIPS